MSTILENLICSCDENSSLKFNDNEFSCSLCNAKDCESDGVIRLNTVLNEEHKDIQKFWGDLYQQLYSSHQSISELNLELLLPELANYEKESGHCIGNEIIVDQVEGKSILEIGCGAGAHSSIFKSNFSNLVSLDITPERILSTSIKLDSLSGGQHKCIEGNAEHIPFKKNTFDFVYSFGVLHHSTDDKLAIKEAVRVCKKGGDIVLMLYAKYSFMYFMYLIWFGYIKGYKSKYGKNWLGPATEGVPKNNDVPNPFTRAYSKKELIKIFNSLGEFDQISIRKGGFWFHQLPIIGKLVENFLIKSGIGKYTDAGYLVWEGPVRKKLWVEHFIGYILGWNLYIKLKKK